MDTWLIVVIVVAVLLLLLLLFLLPRMRRQAAERRRQQELVRAREERAQLHQREADEREREAVLAERRAREARAEAEMRDARAAQEVEAARQARAEAELHRVRAEAHARGEADEELGFEGGSRSSRSIDMDRDGVPDAAERGGATAAPAPAPQGGADLDRDGVPDAAERGGATAMPAPDQDVVREEPVELGRPQPGAVSASAAEEGTTGRDRALDEPSYRQGRQDERRTEDRGSGRVHRPG